jgi:rhamnosyl/mannosyltransferase
MKILQLGKAFPPVRGIGGVEKVIELFYYGLNSNYIDCDVLGVNDKFKYEIDSYCNNGKIYREKLLKKVQSTFLSLHLITRLFKISNKYDIIHVHHPDPMSFLSLFFVRPKAKIIIHWHSDIIRQKFTYFFYQILEKWMLRRADLILCTTPKYYDGNRILKPFLNKINYLPIGFKKENVDMNENLINSIQNSKKNRNQVLFIGRLVYYKGLEYLIRSISLIKSFSYLCIIGEGEYHESLKKLTKLLQIEHKVHFLGNLNDADKIAYLMTSDILVLPSIFKSEAYGIVQVEAMAYGIPVISTKIDGSGIDWVNQNGITGFTVPVCDENSLAEAIDQICFDSSLHLKLSTGALDRFQQELTEEIMIKNLINFYKQILS